MRVREGVSHFIRHRPGKPFVVPSSHDFELPPRQRRNGGALVGEPPSARAPAAGSGTRKSLHRDASIAKGSRSLIFRMNRRRRRARQLGRQWRAARRPLFRPVLPPTGWRGRADVLLRVEQPIRAVGQLVLRGRGLQAGAGDESGNHSSTVPLLGASRGAAGRGTGTLPCHPAGT